MEFFGWQVPEVVFKIVLLLIAIIAAVIVSRALGRVLTRVLDRANVPSASIFVNVARALIWVIALMMVLQPVFGIEPTGFIAALGVTSIALSLGLQDTIANLFGGFTLMIGKVIEPGDIITADGVTGKVIDINWRATSVELFNGDVRVIPNKVLSGSGLTKLDPFQAGEYTLPIMFTRDADLEQACAEIEEIAREVLGEYYDEAFGAPVFIIEYSNFGIMANISLHCKEGIRPGRARTLVGKAIAGKPWLA